MDKNMNEQILKDILNLENGKGYFILNYSYAKKDDNFTIVFNGDANFLFVLGEENTSLMALEATKLAILYREELDKDLEVNNIDESELITISVRADDEGNYIGTFVRGFDNTKANPEHIEEITDNITKINNDFNKNLTKLLDEFAEKQDLKNNF